MQAGVAKFDPNVGIHPEANALPLEHENLVQTVDITRDALYQHDESEQKAMLNSRPWKNDPRHFKEVRISAVALLKMVTHARSGGSLEVMGLMQGRVVGNAFIVMDAFRLPVEGTETRVNAQEEANEYMPAFLQAAREAGQMENAVGWYHSHPGYGCWLSGIDVATQAAHQVLDPYVAVVIDPDRTISSGKVDIGAFRTYPENYKPSASDARAARGASEDYQSIPMAKIEDFGAHSSRYYSLDVSVFKSTLDAHLLERLWKKYWVSTLSQSPLNSNRDFISKQMTDLAMKLRKAEQTLSQQPKAFQVSGAGNVNSNGAGVVALFGGNCGPGSGATEPGVFIGSGVNGAPAGLSTSAVTAAPGALQRAETVSRGVFTGVVSGGGTAASFGGSSASAASGVTSGGVSSVSAVDSIGPVSAGIGVGGTGGGAISSGGSAGASIGGVPGADTTLSKIVRESNKLVAEEIKGLMAGVIKERLFSATADRPKS